jgi:uncharacterized membrane protein YjjP (DUF1212 family)
VQITFLADAAILTVDGATVSFARLPTVPALDQVARFKQLLVDLEGRDLTPRQVHTRIDEIATSPPRWSQPMQVLGLVLFAVGFGISVQATWQEVGVSATTGLLVGLLVIAGQRWPRLVLVSPFLASVVVSVVVLQLFEHDVLDGGPIQLIVPALFFFIPGDSITAAGPELSVGRMTAGSARLIYSVVMLLVLAFGAVVAAVIVGAPVSDLYDVTVSGNLGQLAVWGGWVAFAAGVMLTFQMRPRDFPWALGMVLLTAATVELGVRAFGDPLGTCLGAVVMTVVSLLLARSPDRPPAYVMYLGAFYVLTPGSHGLLGLESWIGGDPITGVASIGDMVSLLVAIVIGILVGATVVRRSIDTI